MYIDNSIPSAYDRIAELTDNYVVLVREQTLYNSHTYDAYVQYFNPSVLVVHLDRYVITKGNQINYSYNYINNGLYTYVESVDENFSLSTSSLSDISNDYWDRYDLPQILFCQFLFVFLFVWVLNQLSKFVKKGGVFSG